MSSVNSKTESILIQCTGLRLAFSVFMESNLIESTIYHALILQFSVQGIIMMTSPLSIPSSSDDPPKSSISSLNLSSGDESSKDDKTRSTFLNQSPVTIPKTTGNPRNIKALQACTKPLMKPLNSQSIGGNIERAVPSEESCQSDSSDFHLTPEFARPGGH